MMQSDTSKLGHASAAFGLSVAITILFNTALAWAKDAYNPLKVDMAALTGHDWTAQGLADVILFVGLGLFFVSSGWPEKITPNRLVAILVGSAVVAGLGLFAWYALF